MFGIGGGELLFIIFIVLMLFGADKVPEIARTLGKVMAQVKNATNDIKHEIQKGAENNGFDNASLNNLTGGISSEINNIKENIVGNTSLPNLSDIVSSEVKKTTAGIGDIAPEINTLQDEIEDIAGPIKRKM